MTKTILSISLIITVLIVGTFTLSQQVFSEESEETVYSVDRGGVLRTIDPNTASTITAVQITLNDFPVIGATGLAADDGELYVILKGFFGRTLATINPDTGVATKIGNLSEKFAELAFADGTLFAVSGTGASTPNTLFILDKMTASATLVCKLGNGTDGETIAYNPEDERLYHGSGFTDSGTIFEKITDTSTNPCTTSDIPLSGDSYDEQASLTYWPSEEVFLSGDSFDILSGDFGRTLSTITGDGVITRVGFLDHTATGLAVVIENSPPVAEVSDVTVSADSNCQATASIDDGSFDPDGDPITLSQDPAGPYSLGDALVTLTVSDGTLSDSDAATVSVIDDTAPDVTVALFPFGNNDDDDEGRFVVEISAIDNCDANPVIVSAVLNAGQLSLPVTNGQEVGLEIDDDSEVEFEDGILEIEAPSFELNVTAEDASGNVGTGTATPTFVDDDDDDDDDEDDEFCHGEEGHECGEEHDDDDDD